MAKLDKIADMTGLYPAAIRQGFTKLDPRLLWRNPVMFVTAVVAAMTTVLGLRDLITGVPGAGSALHIAFWLWLCVVFANFAEALAEGRGRARADTLRATKSETRVRVLADADADPGTSTQVVSTSLRAGQFIHIAAGDIIPTDGDVVRGMASVNESAITGESAPVIRESGGDRSSVTGGTMVVSDWIVMRVTAEPGKSFLDRMITLVEGAERQKTPNEIALNILLVGLTLIFLFVVVTLPAFASYSGTTIPVVVLGALFVTLIPTAANGSLMMRDGTVIGSTLIAQSFTGAAYLHPRASASSWNAAGTGATNLGPTSSILIAQVAERRTAWEAENGTPAPIDAVTTSGSRLDPDISPETAMAQADRIATARKADPAAVRALIEGATRGRFIGLYGNPTVNVLTTNAALDSAFPMTPAGVEETTTE